MFGFLHEEHVAGRPDVYLPLESVISYGEFVEMTTSEDYLSLTAKKGDTALGFAVAKLRTTPDNPLLRENRTFFIEEIFVLPAYRHQKIGERLFKEIEAQGKMQGVKRIDLNVWAFNEGALRFYEKLGMNVQRLIYEKEIEQ